MFYGCLKGYIDSILLLRKVFLNKHPTKSSSNKNTFTAIYSVHNAIEDVEALGNLVWHDNMETADLLKHNFIPRDFFKPDTLQWGEKKTTILWIRWLTTVNIVTAEPVAGQGWISHIFPRSMCLNSEWVARVISSKLVLEDVFPKLTEYFKLNCT